MDGMERGVSGRRLCLRAAVVAVGCLVAAAGASGCQSAEESFARHVHPLQRQLSERKAQLGATLRQARRHDRATSQLLAREIDAIDQADAVLAKLSAPGAAKAPFAAYNSANAGLVAALRAFANVLASGSKAQLTPAGEQAQEAAGAVQRADDALQAALPHVG
jgi:hypothetical protein